jgi:hypothetical protein
VIARISTDDTDSTTPRMAFPVSTETNRIAVDRRPAEV